MMMAVAAPYGGHVGSARIGVAYPPLCKKSIPGQVHTMQAPIAKLRDSLRVHSGSLRLPPTSWARLVSPLMYEGDQANKADWEARGGHFGSSGPSLKGVEGPHGAAGARHFGRVSKCRPLGWGLGAPQDHPEALLGPLGGSWVHPGALWECPRGPPGASQGPLVCLAIGAISPQEPPTLQAYKWIGIRAEFRADAAPTLCRAQTAFA